MNIWPHNLVVCFIEFYSKLIHYLLFLLNIAVMQLLNKLCTVLSRQLSHTRQKPIFTRKLWIDGNPPYTSTIVLWYFAIWQKADARFKLLDSTTRKMCLYRTATQYFTQHCATLFKKMNIIVSSFGYTSCGIYVFIIPQI